MPFFNTALGGRRSRKFRPLSGGVVIDPPTFVSASTNTAGTVVTVEFSKEMADPTGKHAQFTVNDGSANAVTAAELNADTTKIDLTLTNAIEYGDAVTVAYTEGDVVSADGGVLATFTAQTVTNTVPSPYQQWTDLPQSPLLTSNYPYQFIYVNGSIVQVVMCVTKWYVDGVYVRTSGEYKYSQISGGAWGSIQTYNGKFGSQYNVTQCNNDIYTDSNFTTVWKAKTTA